MGCLPNGMAPCCFETITVAGCYTQCPKCGYDFSAAPQFPDALPIGTVLKDTYVLGRVLGQGGFGITYVAYNKNLDMKVAIKEYFPSDISARGSNGCCSIRVNTDDSQSIYQQGKVKFLDEAKTLAKVGELHNVVRIYEYFEAHNTAYIVMGYVQGKTLKNILSERPNGKMPFDEVFNLLKPCMDALNNVHAGGLLHMDISPDNIMITKSGQPVLIDFGAAKSAIRINRNLTQASAYKFGYSPIETRQSDGRIGPWSDIYSMAATLYRAVTGTMPPDALDRIGEDTCIAPKQAGAEITEEADAAITKALSMDIKSRPQSIHAFVDLLSSEHTRPIAPEPPAPPSKKKSKFPRWLLVAMVVLIIGGIGLCVFRWQGNSARNAMERIASAEDYLNGGESKDWNQEKILKLISDLEEQRGQLDEYCLHRLGYLEYRVWEKLDSKYIKQFPQVYTNLLIQSANNSYPLAQFELGCWYNTGDHDGVPKDEAQAEKFFKNSLPGLEKIADANSVDNHVDDWHRALACLYTANLYNDTGWIEKNYEKALSYYQIYLAYKKSQNEQIASDIQAAIAECEVGVAEEYYNRGNHEDWDKIVELLSILEKDKKQYLDSDHIKRLAYIEYRMYDRLSCDTQYINEHKGVNATLLKQSAQNNFPLAMCYLGEFYDAGVLVEKNPSKGKELLNRSFAGLEALAKESNANSILTTKDKTHVCYWVAARYHFGELVEQDLDKALLYYQKVQQYQEGQAKPFFDDVPGRIQQVKSEINYSKLVAVENWLNGQSNQSVDEILKLEEALSATKDNGELDSRLLKRLGYVQYRLAGLTKVNDEKCLELNQKAADNGFVLATFRLGAWYSNGAYGLDENIEKAKELYALAATNGLTELANNNSVSKYDRGYAWYGMGEAYRIGLGVKQDRKHALQCYKKAKSMGHNVPQWAIDEVK